MNAECYPMSVLPHVTKLYAEYLEMGESGSDAAVQGWYGGEPMSQSWYGGSGGEIDRERLADALRAQSKSLESGEATLVNIERLRNGAKAVVTGQQVGLLGGPLLTLLKAATAIARAKEATARSGVEHVPVFWLATEDHDLEEVDQVTLLTKMSVETLRLGLKSDGRMAGGVRLGAETDRVVEQAGELLGYAPVWQMLKEFYLPGATLGEAFAKLITKLFSSYGLIVMDASGREFHALGSPTLRAAIEQAEELEQALLRRTKELEAAGYHAQVLVKAGASLLFLVDERTGERQALRRAGADGWRAGTASYSADDLMRILEDAPERLSPNALLRPVFQDTILPRAAYVGGPAEVAYFAQSAVLYEAILGRVTPVLPRFSATLIEPAIDAVMKKDELSLKDVIEAKTVEALTQRLGARAMPIEGKRRLAAAGNAMDAELEVLTSYMASMDESLGRSAGVSANKMRYQMNRLRRMAATFEVQKEASLAKHAGAMVRHLLPAGHPQERLIGGVWFLAQGGEELVDRLVEEAGKMCLGHGVVRL